MKKGREDWRGSVGGKREGGRIGRVQPEENDGV